jgi:DNA-binding protein
MTEDNVVYIGSKPVMNYVLAVVTQFNNGAKEVTVKARGKAISRAVDVVEVSRNRFLSDAKIKDIKIGTEKIATERGESNVSIIEIVLAK